MSAISETSARLAGVWMDALTRASAFMGLRDQSSVAQAFSSPYPSESLSKMIETAAADLPGLLHRERDRNQLQRIKQRWLESYSNFVCDTFGIPPRTQAQRVADRWRHLLESLSGGDFTAASGLSFLFTPMAWTAPAWSFPAGTLPETGVFGLWMETYRRAFQKLFLPQSEAVGRDREKKVRRAFEAQVKFLDFLPEFHEKLMTAARKGLENVLQSITSRSSAEVTPEVYRDFFETWIASHEKEFMSLFLSKPFMDALEELVRLSGKAREKMDSLMTSGLSLWDLPSHKELDVIREAVEKLRAEVCDLQERVRQLSGLVDRKCREEESAERPCSKDHDSSR